MLHIIQNIFFHVYWTKKIVPGVSRGLQNMIKDLLLILFCLCHLSEKACQICLPVWQEEPPPERWCPPYGWPSHPLNTLWIYFAVRHVISSLTPALGTQRCWRYEQISLSLATTTITKVFIYSQLSGLIVIFVWNVMEGFPQPGKIACVYLTPGLLWWATHGTTSEMHLLRRSMTRLQTWML